MQMAPALGLARGLHMAGCFTLFGTTLLAAGTWRFGAIPVQLLSLRHLARYSLLAAFAAGCCWFLLQSADMAAAANLHDLLTALPLVIGSTRFGHLLLLRGLLMIAAMVSFEAGRPRIAAALAGCAVVAQAWLGHGGAMTGNCGAILLIASIIHLAAGAAWIGSLPALFLLILRLPQLQAAELARSYSPFGLGCVAALLGSAIVQFYILVGSPVALFDTLYGRVVLLKILLLSGLILLAALNRYRLAPALQNLPRPGARTRILSSIGLEILLGLGALLAAGLLLQLSPPMMAAGLGAPQ